MKNTKSIQFFADPAIQGIEISKVDATRHVFPKHAHDSIFALSLITSGASYCLGKDCPDSTVTKGEIVTLNPGQVHSGHPVGDNPISYWMLYTDIDTMADFAGDIFERPGIVPEFKKMVVNNRSIARHFQKLLHAYERQSDSLKKEVLLNEFFSRLMRNACDIKQTVSPLGCENESIDLAKQYLSQDLDIGISLEYVAKKVGLSRFHFIRQFKRYTGVSPHQFRIQRRIEAAKKLIRTGVAFSQVALETGFADQSHFTNKFRQYTGATPSQYARR